MSSASDTGDTTYTDALAEKADFTGFCELALPDLCADYYSAKLREDDSTVSLGMEYGEHFQVCVRDGRCSLHPACKRIIV